MSRISVYTLHQRHRYYFEKAPYLLAFLLVATTSVQAHRAVLCSTPRGYFGTLYDVSSLLRRLKQDIYTSKINVLMDALPLWV